MPPADPAGARRGGGTPRGSPPRGSPPRGSPPRGSPRATPRGSPSRTPPRGSPRAAAPPKGSPRAAATAPKGSPRATAPKASPRTAPKGSPRAAPKGSPRTTAPKGAARAAPKASARAAAKGAKAGGAGGGRWPVRGGRAAEPRATPLRDFACLPRVRLALFIAAGVVVLGAVVACAVVLSRRGRGGGGEGGKNGVGEHQAHAVGGARGYDAIDLERRGWAEVLLDGSQSHSHYVDPGPPVVTGSVVRYSWFGVEGGDEFSSGVVATARFGVGVTEVGLTVEDNLGDVHTDTTEVRVRGPDAEGAYCYYYAGDAEVGDAVGGDGARPVFAAANGAGVQFAGLDAFPGTVSGGAFVARCLFRLAAAEGGRVAEVAHAGGVRVLVGGGAVYEAFPDGGGVVTKEVDVSAGGDVDAGGAYEVQVVYYYGGGGEGVLTVGGLGDVTYDLGGVAPVLLGVEPASSTLAGGGRAKVVGVGMYNRVTVKFDGVAVGTNLSNVDLDTAFFTVPPASAEGAVRVTVENAVAASNAVAFNYSKTGLPPLKFGISVLTPAPGEEPLPQLITGLAYGPDHRWYASSLDGHVYAFGVARDLTVRGVCKSEGAGKDRAVLAVAFNPAETAVRVYASASVLDWRIKKKIASADGWTNGAVQLFEPAAPASAGGACLALTGSVITGLPVSNHDHAVNGIVFDQRGRLHVQVGGFTNAGHNTPGNKLGGLSESPLSAASLVADVNAPGFDGAITYDSDDPGVARQVSGDVRVYAPGFRNSFGIAYHSRGLLLATDNGPSTGFGDVSVSCSESAPLSDHVADKLLVVHEGRYYGAPNRNRGRDDAAQCVYKYPSAPRDATYEPSVASFESSTDGVLEYTANVLGGQLKGDVLASKYATAQAPGRVYRARLNAAADGAAVDSLAEVSGLSIAMSPHGVILMPRVYTPEIIALSPAYDPPTIPALSAVLPFRGPRAGGNLVQVSGHNLGPGAVAYFGVKPCTGVQDAAPDGSEFRCRVPPGEPGESVQVSVAVPGAGTAESYGGVDYQYMEI